MNAINVVTVIIGIVIALIVMTSLAPTVINSTDTRACTGALENKTYGCGIGNNASATGKTMYSLMEFMYPIIGVLFIVGVGFKLSRR